jgi:two-component system, LuxR family, response regulator FixJ
MHFGVVHRNGNRMDSAPVVFVVDDDPKMLRMVTDVLSAEQMRVEAYSRGDDFLSSYRPQQRGCLLLDIQMLGLSGPELQKELAARKIELPIVFLTGTADVPTTVDLMKRGAVDLLQKPFEIPVLLESVRLAIQRDATGFFEKTQRELIQLRLHRLTPREHEVMELVVTGRANKQIAYELHLSEKTVEIHRSRVMKKMEAQSVAELVRQCLSGVAGLASRGLG